MIFSFVLTGANAVKYIINHAEITALFCSQDKLQNVSLPFLFQLGLHQSH
jgi:long-subunit acyl-CoA synthetase (AMP-forming)